MLTGCLAPELLWLFQAASTQIFTFDIFIEIVIFFFSKNEYK